LSNNVILLTIDSLRADKLGCFGYQRNITPNIDFLARDGITFTNAFSNGPLTSFSFPSIFTSSYALMYPSKDFKYTQSGEVYMPSIYGGNTLAEALRREGFYTIGIHSNPWLSSYYNYNRGFNRFIELLDPSPSSSYARFFDFLRKGRVSKIFEMDFFETFLNRKYRDAEEITRTAINCIEKNTKRKFFLWVHYMDPHRPYIARSFSKNASSYLRMFLNMGDKAKLYEQLYECEIEYADRVIGNFLRRLEQMGIWIDENFIFLTADHGEEFGEHGGTGHYLKLYDELLHVPLIIDGPDIEKKQTANHQVELLDVSPTICNLIGIKLPESFQGKSLFTTSHSEGVISEYAEKNESGFSFRNMKWKFILIIRKGGIRRELYDLTKDKKETLNVYERNKDIGTVYERCLLKHIEEEDIVRKKYGLTKRKEEEGPEQAYAPEKEEKIKSHLRSLGYL